MATSDFPQDIVDEAYGAEPSSPPLKAGPVNQPEPDGSAQDGTQEADKAMPQILTPDEQAVQHRISEAMAMLIYDKGANEHIVKMAMQGPEGMVRAIGMVMDKVVSSAKPGVPRELLPTTALAAFIILNDFLMSMGAEAVTLDDALPLMIRILGSQFKASPVEQQQLRRILAKYQRAEQRKSIMQQAQPEQAPETPPAEEEAVEEAPDDEDNEGEF